MPILLFWSVAALHGLLMRYGAAAMLDMVWTDRARHNAG